MPRLTRKLKITCGMSVRDIMHHLEQVYGTQLSHETVSRITDAVMEEARAWQARPLDPIYAAVFLDAIVVKVRDAQVVQNKPVYVAVGVDADGEKHVLRIWLARTPPQTATAGKGARRSSPDPAGHLTSRGARSPLIIAARNWRCAWAGSRFSPARSGTVPSFNNRRRDVRQAHRARGLDHDDIGRAQRSPDKFGRGVAIRHCVHRHAGLARAAAMASGPSPSPTVPSMASPTSPASAPMAL